MNTSVLLAALLLVATPAFAENAPALPRATVEIPALKTSGQTIRVPAGGDLQKALDDAKPGDRIELQPRATYEGPFRLKVKDGDDWIVITTSGELPKPGRHIQPSHAAAMPKLISAGDFLVSTDPGAHHYRFVGIEFAPKAGSFVTTLIQFGDKETSADAVPHHLIVDRCYVHGDAKLGARRGVALNGRNIAVIDSYIADFKEVGADSQAVSGWNGPGPIKIANNYLEAAGENIMFGGADPKIADLVPSDIEVVHNHLSKPLEEGRSVVRGHRVVGQEPVRAEERAPGRRRREPARVQLAAGAEWLRDSLHRQKSRRRRALVHDRGRHLLEQPDSPRRRRHQHARQGRQQSEPAGQPPGDPQQRVPRRRRQVGQRPSLPDARRGGQRHHRSQHRVSDRQHPVRRRSRTAYRLRLPEQRGDADGKRRQRLERWRRDGHAEALLPRGGVPAQRDRGRRRGPVSEGQLLPIVTSGCGADDSARRRLPSDAGAPLFTRGDRRPRSGRRR